jgi:serine/threonine protein kinase
MGEVYRARDTSLGRDVALKILPDTVASDPDRVGRFRREAQILASLNHPLIAAIYGVEDSGATPVLVLELVEGLTLAERIAAAQLPLDEALRIAHQIVQALAAAHERGIVHRDFKPANIKLRPDGTVKVLDFGLARALEPASNDFGSGALATVTSPAVTAFGVILGTAAYMSPEQACGQSVDRGADIWAFGAVLFEMLTGSRAFVGSDPTQTVASVLRSEPDWSRLPSDTPESIRRLLRRCLEKDRRRRRGFVEVWALVSAGCGSSGSAWQERRSLACCFVGTPWRPRRRNSESKSSRRPRPIRCRSRSRQTAVASRSSR